MSDELPIAGDDAVCPAVVERPPARRRVLLAEDAADPLADQLAAAGYDVAVCQVAESPAAAELVRPHLILIDASAAAWPAVRRVRQRAWGGGVRILAVCGWEEAVCRADAVAAGCDGQLLRPVVPEEVACLLGGQAAHITS